MDHCPFCGTSVTYLRGNGINSSFPNLNVKAVTFSCPSCNKILAASVDPLALKADIVKEVLEEVGRKVESSKNDLEYFIQAELKKLR